MRVIFAAGGTAGHINPALAVAHRFAATAGNKILFIGTQRGMEKDLVPREGFDIKFIEVQGFKRSLTLENIKVAAKAARSLSAAKKIIREFKPDLVVGCGGYVSGPAVYSAASMKIPTLIHEQNVVPGFTTKILSKKAKAIAVSFEETLSYLPKKKIVEVTGNPVRKSILEADGDAYRTASKIEGRPLLLVFGGSLGAGRINDAMIEAIPELDPRIKVVWGTGKRNYDEIIKRLEGTDLSQVDVLPYIYNMDEVMNAADLVVARSGAITMGELCAIGKPSILIPSPNVTNNHQEYNARALEKRGGALVICEKELTKGKLSASINELLANEEQRKIMGQQAKAMGKVDAVEKIYQLGLKIMG